MKNYQMKLYCQIEPGTEFHYGDQPTHIVIKHDGFSVCSHGVKRTDPHVLVFEEKKEAKTWETLQKEKS